MSSLYRFFRYRFEISYKNNMKTIFKSIVGMTLITGLFMVFGALIKFITPELEPITSAVKGFVFITLLMGIVIISKSGIDLFYKYDSYIE